MDSKNIRNIAGFNVGNTQLKHVSGLVGMSGADPTNNNAIRFWSGNADPTIASFRVTQGGKLTAVGAQFMSTSGYPRITFNESADSLMQASLDADHYIYITPDFVGGTPALVWQDPVSSTQMFIKPDGSGDFMLNPSQKIIISSSSNDVHLQCATGRKISVNSWNELYNRFNSQTMQAALNAKANTFSGASGTVYVSSTSGGPATTPISFSNGIRTS
jgi:hypothetical protein